MSDVEWHQARAAFETACRERLRDRGGAHADCAFKRLVVEAGEVQAHCRHVAEPVSENGETFVEALAGPVPVWG